MPKQSYKGIILPDPQHLAYYVDRPVEFVKDTIFQRIDKRKYVLDPYQEEMLRAVAATPNVAIRSGHGVGKTSSISFIIMWFLMTRPDSLVVVTGPKADQLRKTLWTEVNRWLMYCPLKQFLEWHPETIRCVINPEQWYATYVTTKSSGNLQGFHAEHLLFVVDECFSVDDKIFEVIEGAITGKDGKNKRLFCGNPTASSGYCYDIFHKDYYEDNRDWTRLHFDSSKSTIVDPEFANRIAKKFGRDSDIYRTRVEGEFPEGDQFSYIPLADCDKARNRDVSERPDNPLEVGVDVARYGSDRTVICFRRGHKVYPLHKFSRLDNVEVASEVVRLVKEYREMTPRYNGYISVKVDSGGVGGGVVDILRRDTSNKLNIVAVNFGEKAKDEEKYVNMATEMWGDFKDRLPFIDLPADDEDLVFELSTRRLEPHKSNRLCLETKDKYRDRHDCSPDLADAVVLAFADSPKDEKTISNFSRSNKRQFKDFDMDFSSIKFGTHTMICSMHMDEDSQCGITLSLYDNEVARLYVLDELDFGKPRPDVIVKMVAEASIRLGVMGEGYRQRPDPWSYYEAARRWQWVSNNAMFGLSVGARKMEGARAYAPAYEFAQKPFGIAITPNLQFDFTGASSTFSMLMSKGKMTINTRCELLADAIDSDKQTPILQSILGTVAYIGPSITRAAGKPLKEYSSEKEEAIKRLNKEYVY